MAAEPVIQHNSERRSECWCCGLVEDADKLVHLGNHPEVALCTRCAHWISKRARQVEDEDLTGIAVRVRDEFRRLRHTVVERGWHEMPIVGRPLRWVGKHTP